MKKRRVVFDIEADGLLHKATTIWMLVAIDIDTGERFIFCDFTKLGRPLDEAISFLDSCTLIAGHNILMYDLLMLEKFFHWKPKFTTKLVDTMVMSQVLNYKRFGFGHSLGKWGEFLNYSKVDHDEWHEYSDAMLNRCIVDVELNLKVYNYLISELSDRKNREVLMIGLRAEHGMSRFVGRAQLHGWPFDIKKAKALLVTIEKRMIEIRMTIEPKLRTKTVQIDKEPEFKKPVWVQNGNYAARTCQWFSIEPSAGLEERPIWGDYCRIEFEDPDMGSLESVKEYLYSLGWVPDDWNFDKVTKKPTTPKLTDSSLGLLGKDGLLISEFYTIRARHSILTTWVTKDYVAETGRIHGDCFVIGTPTGRSRHEIIANIPSADAVFGKEFRELFTCLPGYKLVGVDSKGNQARALCHYLGNKEFTEKVLASDIHKVNQEVLERILGSMGDDARRKSKAFYYALIFGGGDAKLGLITTGKRSAEAGKKVRGLFLKGIPGFDALVSKLNKMYDVTEEKTGKPYIIALDGRPIFVEGRHKTLNYLLQSFEKITVAISVTMGMEELDRRGIDWQPLIVYHDESNSMVKEEFAEEAREIWERAFEEAPKQLGVLIMKGDAKIGNDWFDIH
jgi:DNA polymerase I